MKKFFFWFFLLLCLLPFVNAQPPFLENVDTTEGLFIAMPLLEYVNIDENFTMVFNPFNITSGLRLTNATVDCNSHLTMKNGSLVGLDVFYEENHFKAVVNSSYVSDVGYLPFSIYCNSSNAGGHRTDSLDINKTTSINRESVWPLSLLVIGLLFFFLYLANTFKDSTKWFHQSVRLLLVLSSLWIMVLASNLGVSYANVFSLDDVLIGVMQILYKLILYCASIFTFLLVIYFLYEVLMAFRYKSQKEHEELLGK